MPHPAGKTIARKKLIAALEACGGNQSRAAESLGVTRAAVCMQLTRHPELRTILEQAVERRVDTIEDKLYSLCLEGDTRAITLFLKAKGKARGYVDRQEVTGAEGAEVVIRFVDAPAGDDADD